MSQYVTKALCKTCSL